MTTIGRALNTDLTKQNRRTDLHEKPVTRRLAGLGVTCNSLSGGVLRGQARLRHRLSRHEAHVTVTPHVGEKLV